jgi:peptidoglycan/xylan/chitin deacetylase (PgdA/CDA1 family)
MDAPAGSIASPGHLPPAPGWRPSRGIGVSLAWHGAMGVAAAVAPGLWPWALGALAANHLVLTAAGLWPRSTLLGPNLVRLPAAATARRQVALTFDDGPDPHTTPRVLDLLDGAGVRASFFCIGRQARAHPALVREIVARGHRVENHGDSHTKDFAAFGWRRLCEDIDRSQRALTELSGQRPVFFRPLGGLRSPLLDPALAPHGLRLASWTRRGFDSVDRDPKRVLARLRQGLAAGDILLLHDGDAARMRGGRPVVLELLPPLLAELRDAGLQPVTLAEAAPA